MQPIFINPFTDFGFKKIFGEEASKPLLMDFLNSILPSSIQIKELSFKNLEQLPQTDSERKAVYDIYCENQNGEKFIVELQKLKQGFFKDRTIYYSTFPIRQQAEKGGWDYKLNAVFCIGILDFTFDDYASEPEKSEVIHIVKLKNQNNKVFYEKLTYIYLEMPNFKLLESELKTRLDQWLYFIKNLEDFQSIPIIFQDSVFIQAFEVAKMANLAPIELEGYEQSLKILRDNYATWKYAIETALAEGKAEGELRAKLEIAKNLKTSGMSETQIMEFTGLSKDQLEQLE
jgi:predicted transposase/invertase (TIGR01784 family)